MKANLNGNDDTLVEIVHRNPDERACVPDVMLIKAGEILFKAGDDVTALYSLESGRVMITLGKRDDSLSDLPQNVEFVALPEVPGLQQENKPVIGAFSYFRRAPSPWTFTALEDCVIKMVDSATMASAYEAQELPAIIHQTLRDSDYTFALTEMVADRMGMVSWSGMELSVFDEQYEQLEQDLGAEAAWDMYARALMACFRDLVERRNQGVPLHQQSLVTDVEALHFHRNRQPGR